MSDPHPTTPETSPQTIDVHYLPQFVSEADLAGQTVVVIDLLRASSTICQALSAGATEVQPFLTVPEVLQASQGQSRDDLILGGERNCEIIEGFDLGNSPADYTAEHVFGKRVLFTTTNGTGALLHARLAKRIVVGAINNRQAVVDAVSGESSIHLLCAGTNGHVTREDILAAGAIASGISQTAQRRPIFNDLAQSAVGEWQELLTTGSVLGRSVETQLTLELRETPGGKNLIAIDHDDDLGFCSQIDSQNVVPEFDYESRRITAR